MSRNPSHMCFSTTYCYCLHKVSSTDAPTATPPASYSKPTRLLAGLHRASARRGGSNATELPSKQEACQEGGNADKLPTCNSYLVGVAVESFPDDCLDDRYQHPRQKGAERSFPPAQAVGAAAISNIAIAKERKPQPRASSEAKIKISTS